MTTEDRWRTAPALRYKHWVDDDGRTLCGIGRSHWDGWYASTTQECNHCRAALKRRQASKASFALQVLNAKREDIARSLKAKRATIDLLDQEVRRNQARLDDAIKAKDLDASKLEEIEHAISLLGGE